MEQILPATSQPVSYGSLGSGVPGKWRIPAQEKERAARVREHQAALSGGKMGPATLPNRRLQCASPFLKGTKFCCDKNPPLWRSDVWVPSSRHTLREAGGLSLEIIVKQPARQTAGHSGSDLE